MRNATPSDATTAHPCQSQSPAQVFTAPTSAKAVGTDVAVDELAKEPDPDPALVMELEPLIRDDANDADKEELTLGGEVEVWTKLVNTVVNVVETTTPAVVRWVAIVLVNVSSDAVLVASARLDETASALIRAAEQAGTVVMIATGGETGPSEARES